MFHLLVGSRRFFNCHCNHVNVITVPIHACFVNGSLTCQDTTCRCFCLVASANYFRDISRLLRVDRNYYRRNARTRSIYLIFLSFFRGFITECVCTCISCLGTTAFRRKDRRILTSVVRITFRNPSSCLTCNNQNAPLRWELRGFRDSLRNTSYRRRLKGRHFSILRTLSRFTRDLCRMIISGFLKLCSFNSNFLNCFCNQFRLSIRGNVRREFRNFVPNYHEIFSSSYFLFYYDNFFFQGIFFKCIEKEEKMFFSGTRHLFRFSLIVRVRFRVRAIHASVIRRKFRFIRNCPADRSALTSNGSLLMGIMPFK